MLSERLTFLDNAYFAYGFPVVGLFVSLFLAWRIR